MFGPPGAGKGTQAIKISKHLNLKHLSTGDLFRYNIENKTRLGQLAKTFINKGELVPDQVTIEMLKNEVNRKIKTRGFVFDGFPRTLSQAKSLDSFLEEKGTQVHGFISLIVSDQTLVKRLLTRGKDSRRDDDQNENIIRMRIREYYDKTNPLINFYKGRVSVLEFDGENEINIITQSMIQLINETFVQ